MANQDCPHWDYETESSSNCTRCTSLLPEHLTRDEHGYPNPLRSGGSRDEDGGQVQWCVFDRANPWVAGALAEYPDPKDADYLARELTGWESYAGRPGGWFAQVPWVRVYSRRVLVVQRGGLDL